MAGKNAAPPLAVWLALRAKGVRNSWPTEGRLWPTRWRFPCAVAERVEAAAAEVGGLVGRRELSRKGGANRWDDVFLVP